MNPEIMKKLLQENVINREVVLDKAYQLFSKKKSSKEIEKMVTKIIKKAKTEKDALNRLDKIKERVKQKNESVSFDRRVKKFLGEEAIEDVWERNIDEKKLNKIAQIIDRIIDPQGDDEVEDWEVPSGEIKRLAVKKTEDVKKEVLKKNIIDDEFVKSVKKGNGWKGLVATASGLL